MHVGVNLNNREALIAPGYGVPQLLDLGERVEQLGFDSVWVGDSLLSKPRYEPLTLLGALAQRTSSVGLGTACLVTTLRHPVQLAHAWATLDVISGGRTVLGACAGNVAEDAAKREFDVLGFDRRRRMRVFEEGLQVIRELLDEGRTEFVGEHFDLREVAFETGTEPHPLLPIQKPVPIWVVANPSIGAAREQGASRAARRVAEFGSGWMTCCRASRPEEVESFLDELGSLRQSDDFEVAYQVTISLGDAIEDALLQQRSYIDAYYPGFGGAVSLADWGPAGEPDEVAAWFRRFADAGVTAFVCRFASLDQPGQVERFAREVLPALRG